jgi:predicted dehydrogenase
VNLRAAVVGVGFVGKAHIEALRRLGIPIQGVLGSSVTRTEAACRGLGLSRAYTSLEELVGDSSVDVVPHVCTPNYLHFLEAQAALQSGKHVMCEKPLAMNTQETGALVDLATTRCVRRHVSWCSRARSANRVWFWEHICRIYANDWNWRLEPELGGRMRAIADIGTHWLDLIGWITGRRLRELCADLATVIPVRRRPKGPVDLRTINLKPHSVQGPRRL